MAEAGTDIKAEIRALETVLSALAPLDDRTRGRVLAYVQQRFGGARERESSVGLDQSGMQPSDSVASSSAQTAALDIRTLKEEKQPKSAVEMAVLVGYYVAEIAPDGGDLFGTADIVKYFKQAGYRLPTQPNVTLHRAKNAGYLDSSARGQYSLNPVGHNLVTHGLPRSGKQGSTSRSARKIATKKKPNSSSKKKVSTTRGGRSTKPVKAKPRRGSSNG